MKVTPTPLKVKLQVIYAKEFLEYLKEIHDHWNEYSIVWTLDKSLKEILKFNFAVLIEKVSNSLWKFYHSTEPMDKIFTITITYGERLALFKVGSHFSLPVTLVDLDYKIKNGLTL